MADDNYIEVTGPETGQAGHAGGPSRPTGPGDRVEKRDDFSEDAEPVEEPETEEVTVDVLRQQLNDAEERLLRVAADFDNYRKRAARQQEETVRTANDRLLGELLGVVDNFERALQHAKEDADPQSILKGTELIYQQLQALLARYNVTPIEAMGKQFDPMYHEAVMQVDSKEHPEGTVAAEFAKGYRQGDRVIRHSKVGVSRGNATV